MATFASSSFTLCSSPLQRTPNNATNNRRASLSASSLRVRAESSTEKTTTNKSALPISRRLAILLSTLPSITLSFSGLSSAAILEADDDEELLEKVKKDRRKRLERQGIINSSKNETASLQELVYRLSKVGQAIDSNDLPAASDVLGPNIDSDWIKNVSLAFGKLSSSPEEKTEADTCSSSLASLVSSVANRDANSSKIAFVSSANALEKWASLTGLAGQLKGL